MGPSPEAMAAVGSKTAAKRIAESAGVPTIPWIDAGDLEGKALAKAAASIGYPLLVKASAGGGGRGMRIVERESDLAGAVAAARAEAAAAFGDGAIFLEKLLVSPRHIELQILGDAAGQIVAAVGVSGDTSENDELAAVAGIKAAGLVPDTGEA